MRSFSDSASSPDRADAADDEPSGDRHTRKVFLGGVSPSSGIDDAHNQDVFARQCVDGGGGDDVAVVGDAAGAFAARTFPAFTGSKTC